MNSDRTKPRRILLAASLAPASCVRGVLRCAREHHWHLVTDMLHTGSFPRGWRGDGIVVLPGYQRDVFDYVREIGVPTVTVGLVAEFSTVPQVEADHVTIGRLAAQHLLERGFRTFAWAPFINDRFNQEQLLGFESVLREKRYTCRHLPAMHRRVGGHWHDDWTQRHCSLVSELLTLPRQTAIFAYNDLVATEIATACLGGGLSIPDDIAVIGVGNDALECDHPTISLSSVDCDFEGMAYHAAELLESLLNGGAPPIEAIQHGPKGIVARASTAGGTTPHSRIAHALSFIADNYSDPLFGVATVADAVGLSRRQLERLFRTTMNCSVREHIERCRMNEASRLLREHPRVKISEVGEWVGMVCSGNFFRTFRRHFGVTPTGYRLLRSEGQRLLEITPSMPGKTPVAEMESVSAAEIARSA